MQIDWITVLAQIANFLVLVWLLRRFLYDPITQAMTRREDRIAERLSDAREAREATEAEAERLRRKQEELEDRRASVLEEAREKAQELRDRLERELREEMDDRRRNWRESLEDERAEFAREVERRAGREVIEIVRRMLAEFADTDLAGQVAAEFARRLEGLNQEDRARLSEAARDAEHPALVECGLELPPAVRARITRALHENVAQDIDVDYRLSGDIVLGLRMTLGGQTVEWSAGRHLARLETALAEALEAASTRQPGGSQRQRRAQAE